MYGCDIGGTKTEFCAFDEELNPVFTRRTPTPTSSYDRLLETIRQQVVEADAQFDPAATIGVGLPGIVDRCGRSYSVNVPCLTGRRVEADLARVLRPGVATVNDGRAFALSEANGGAGEDHRCMVGVILGTGAFGGYCIDGEVQAGRDGVAGEWGHLPIAATVLKRHDLPLFDCGCGAVGCIECYVSGPGLSRIHKHISGDAEVPEDLVDGMRAGDPACCRTLDIWLDCVASCFAHLVLQINPDIIVVGGGLSGIDMLYSQLPARLSECLFVGVDPPPIKPAKFGEASGVRGAAILAARRRGGIGNPPREDHP